jgi:RimJ/RimL family protein N-acetyltransferase
VAVSDVMASDGSRDWYRLRPLRSGDVPTVAEWFESPDDLGAFATRLPLPVSADALSATWRPILEAGEPRTSWFFGVDDPAGRLVAFAGIEDVNLVHGSAVTPLFIAAEARGRGLGVRARALLLDLAFGQLGLHRVTSFHRADNVASRRINEECGLRPEGCLREAWFAGGRRVDVAVFGILASEWHCRRPGLAAALAPQPSVRCGDDPAWAWPPAGT